MPVSDAIRPSLSLALEEVKKCVVLCANCHRKVHAGLVMMTNDTQ